jgi:hypothetical protein
MSERSRTDDEGRATGSKFYLPAGTPPAFEGSPFERIRVALFDHRI